MAKFHSASFIQAPDSDGYVSVDVKAFKLSIKPNVVVGALQNLEGFFRYDYDSSTNTTLKIKILGKDGSVVSGNVRFCIFVVEGGNIW